MKSTLLRKVAQAAVISILFYYTFVFINLGTIWVMNIGVVFELFLSFLFLLVLFYVQEFIAKVFESPKIQKLPAWEKMFLEAFTVIASSLLVTFVLVYIPSYLVMDVFIPMRVRLAFVVTGIISLCFYYFVERERSQKRLQAEFLRAEQLQKENFRTQLEALKNQVNPHFLFNSLNVLNSLIYKDQKLSTQFVTQLSEMYRATLENGGKPLVTLQEEMRLVQAYIYLMKTRFGETIHFEVDLPDDKMHLEVPPASLQMVLENAIKHNGFSKLKPLTINVFIQDQALVVVNNMQARKDQVPSTGVGLNNIMSRYQYLSNQRVEIETSVQEFKVKLPLLTPETV